MNILLINTNPVVSRLISLCVRDTDTIFEEVVDISLVRLDRYDIVFVDDASFIDGLEDTLKNFMIRKKVFLSSRYFDKTPLNYFDEVLEKPFLPSQITSLLESFNEDHFIFPLSTEDDTEDREQKDTKVLDGSEIERIKAILENDNELNLEPVETKDDYETRKIEVITQHLEADGLEIVSEEEYVETLSKRENKNKKNKKKKLKNKKEKTFTFEETLIAAVEGMKVKKIKKLLKGAEVTIKINFKDKK